MAGFGQFETGNHHKRCGFARAARPQQRQKLPFLHARRKDVAVGAVFREAAKAGGLLPGHWGALPPAFVNIAWTVTMESLPGYIGRIR